MWYSAKAYKRIDKNCSSAVSEMNAISTSIYYLDPDEKAEQKQENQYQTTTNNDKALKPEFNRENKFKSVIKLGNLIFKSTDQF